MRTRTLLGLGALTLSLAILACSTNPATGRSQFNALSTQQEIAMGQEAAPDLVKEMGGEVARHDLRDYITEIGLKLAASTEGDNPNLPWKFTLLDSDVINAFALPGGQVFMSVGLAREMTSEAQLAAVLGHEVGHVTARHINDRLTDHLVVTTIAGVTAAVLSDSENAAIRDITPMAVQMGGQMVLLRYGRSQELEADALGVRYMTSNGYDPRGAVEVMEILAKAMSNDRGLEFMSTHPYPETRIRALNGLIADRYPHTINNPQFERREQQFRARFLSKLALAYPDKAEPAPGAPRPRMAIGPSLWCTHCADDAQGNAHAAAHAGVLATSTAP